MAIINLFWDRDMLDKGLRLHTTWDISRYPHMLVMGATGSGKSYAVRLIMGRLAAKRAPHAKLTVCDYKADDFRFLEGCSRYYAFDRSIDGLNSFYCDFQERQSGTDKSRGMRLLVFDEWAAFLAMLEKKEASEMQKKLATLLMLGRSFNTHVLISVQRADSEYFAKSRDNLSNKVIAMGNISKESAAMFGFERENMMPCTQAGQGHVLTNGTDLQPIIVPTINRPELLERTIKKAVM